jgi:tetratricopeptide (TPR) repeat protein
MDASEIDVLVQRLVANPHDQEALAYAHNAGNADPKSYAVFLEKVGNATPDPSYASHWLSEAANVWSVTLGDPHRAARVLMMAVDKDPTQETAAERLAQLYRDKGEHKALVALLERRAKALNPLAAQNPDLRLHLAGIHEELGRLWTEPPLSTPKKGADNYRRAIELDNTSAYAVYALRELYKQSEQYADALPLFALEQAIVTDTERKLALYRDEAEIRKLLGDRPGATQVLREARNVAQDDAALVQELAASILERMHAGEAVSHAERQEAADLFVSLAEMYPGEHGFAYSTAALDASPGHDRAMQLAGHYARELGRTNELYPRWQEYLQVNPGGAMAPDARRETGAPDMGGYAPRHAPASMGPLPGSAEGDGGGDGGGTEFRAEQVMRTLQEASALAARGQKPQALAKYKSVLATDPAHPEALAWVEDYLRQKRQYAELRDVLMQAARAPNASSETRKQQLLDVAGLCETQLRDLETAIQAWKQICTIDRGDATAREHLRRLLERGGRWDELAAQLEQEAMSTTDSEAKIALEKKLAQLHEVKRKDFVAAGEAWARLAAMLTGDEAPIQTAVKLFEKGQRRDLACQVISECAGVIEDKGVRAALYQKMGELYEKAGELVEAGEAYVQAAESDAAPKMWEAAERSFVAGERWDRAAYVVGQRAELTSEAKSKAALLVKASALLSRAGDHDSALLQVENASSLDPYNDEYAREVERRYTEASRFADLADFFAARADKIDDRIKRQALRKRAASIHTDELGNAEVGREILMKALEDGDDADVLTKLADDAEERGDPEQAQEFLHRLFPLMKTTEERVAVAMREGNLLADALDDADGAIARFLMILDEIDPKNREAVGRIAELEEKRGNHEQVAEALERELKMGIEQQDRLEIARRLAGLYEGPLDNPEGAIRALDIVRALDTEDFEATARLEVLCEKVGDWPRVASLLAALIEIEGDEDELSQLTRKLADILSAKLDRGDEALAALEGPADNGDGPCRDAYVELADRLGWKGIVASKLVEWHGESLPTPERNDALRDAFQRFLGVERFEEAAKVAVELARSKAADHELAEKLEEIALRLKDLEAMSIAHDLLARELSGHERASELVRQAEVLVQAGVDPVEAQQHGETGLSSVPAAQVEPLLTRLATLVNAAGPVIDVYERQIGRCKAPADKLAALARAAQVAAERGALDRAKSFYELAISTGTPEETLLLLELSANQGDREQGGSSLRRTLAEALSGGGQSARDGGRTRGFLLRRAAQIAQRDLGDTDKAFEWLGDALIAHVDSESLDALEELGAEVGDLKRTEATIGRALAEVFDGPLVRQLLARRVKLRRDDLGDKQGAADDLKKLHDLSPADTGVMEELSILLTELGDFRGMVHVLEDQILRHKDPQARAELARKVARLWEERLKDPREAADAWRRVLRMKAGDPDAQAGLERAKTAMLSQRDTEEAAPALSASDADSDEQPPELPALGDPEPDGEQGALLGAADEGGEEAAPDEEIVPANMDDDETFDGTRELPEDTDHAGVQAAAEIETARGSTAANGEETAEQEDILAVDDSELVDEVDLVEELEEEPEPPRAPKR